MPIERPCVWIAKSRGSPRCHLSQQGNRPEDLHIHGDEVHVAHAVERCCGVYVHFVPVNSEQPIDLRLTLRADMAFSQLVVMRPREDDAKSVVLDEQLDELWDAFSRKMLAHLNGHHPISHGKAPSEVRTEVEFRDDRVSGAHGR